MPNQEGKAILRMHRQPGLRLHGMAEANVEKNRKGKLGTARLIFRNELTRFEDLEDNCLVPFPLVNHESWCNQRK